MEVAIALDTYDDLFSDFDIRGYGERALSKDFLDELRVRLRKYWPRPDLAIVLLVPSAERDREAEALIVSRIDRYFVEGRDKYERASRRGWLTALLFVSAGLVLSLAANLIVERFSFLPLFKDFLLVPSWFFVWSGFDLVVNRDDIGKKRRYYKALSSASILFRDLVE
jgi:hypothetical protein